MGFHDEYKIIEYDLDKKLDIYALGTMYIYNFDCSYKGFEESHEQLELLFVAKGSQLVIEDGQEYVVNQGEAFLHKPNAIHLDRPNNCNSKVYIVSFSCVSKDIEILFGDKFSLSKEEIFQLNEIFEYTSKYISLNNIQFWYSGKNKKLPKEAPYGFMHIIKNNLELFFLSLISSKKATIEIDNTSFTFLTKQIIDILDRDKAKKFSLESIADELKYSKTYLCRHFKNNTGITINQYFYNLKISEAKRMLVETEDSIKEISESLNFDSIQYFTLCFKKIVGVAPASWKKNVKRTVYYY